MINLTYVKRLEDLILKVDAALAKPQPDVAHVKPLVSKRADAIKANRRARKR